MKKIAGAIIAKSQTTKFKQSKGSSRAWSWVSCTCMMVAAMFFLDGCASAPKKRMPVTPQPMSCAGKPASITLFSPEEARLVFEDKAYSLKRSSVASGILYSNSDLSYWNKGIEASVTRKGGVITTCTYVPRAGL